MGEKSCGICQHYSVCAWRRTARDTHIDFSGINGLETVEDLYRVIAASCKFYLAPVQEPDFKENWFKIATRIYGEELVRMVKEGMPEDKARLVAFREAILSAVKSEDFLSLARQVPILKAKLEELTKLEELKRDE